MFSKVPPTLSKIFSAIQSSIADTGHFLAKNHYIGLILKYLGFRDYDLPLNQSEDSRFLILLIGLMSFLAVLACSGTFALNSMADRWSSGLENKITIEISPETKEGHLLSRNTLRRSGKRISNTLKNHANIKKINTLTNEEVRELISPWIGDNLTLDDIPLPILIAVELHKADAASIKTLEEKIQEISKHARLETHHEWLSDLLKFTRTLKSLALFVALIIAGTTVTAITAGIKTRLAIHNKEVELLHSMGATDNYIARQFQRHAMVLALQGASVGTFIGLIITLIVMALSTHSGSSLIPVVHIGITGFIFMISIPFIASLVAAITSRFTVLRSLTKMP